MIKLTGVFPIMPAIFNDAGRLDSGGMRGVVEYILESGASGVVFPGLASEYETLTRAERLEYTALIGEWIGDRAVFIVGGSAPSLDDAADYVRAGAEAGAGAAMVLTPHALAHDQAAMATFYRSLGERAGLPVMLQNAPAPMGIGMSIEDVAALADSVDAIRFIKEEAMPSGQRITALTDAAASVEAVFGGAGARYVIDELGRGAKGTMPACEIAEVHVAMLRAYARGDESQARELFERTLPLLSMQAVFRWRLTKEVLRRRGLITSTFTRAAGPSLDAHDLREVDALLDRIADLLTVAPPVARIAA